MNYCPNCGHRMPKDQKDDPVVGGCPSLGMTAKEIAEITGPGRFYVGVTTSFGSELVDVVNVLRGLNTPEDKILERILTRV